MLFDRWRARRAILSRNPPSSVTEPADPRLRAVVEALGSRLGSTDSLGDPCWHYRWEGELQLVGLDATSRSVTDVRQRLLRLVHELDLRHLPRRARRVLAVVLCAPEPSEGLAGWHARLSDDEGEVGVGDWRAARGRITVLAVDAGVDGVGTSRLFGGDQRVTAAVEAWRAEA
jgi:hypothetical protein